MRSRETTLSRMSDGMLSSYRVLDLASGLAAPYAAKLLADLGADVIKVEPPGGDPARRVGPFPGGTPDPESSATFLYGNTSKRGVTLDLAAAPDRERLLQLAATADVVIAGEPEPVLAERGLGLAALRAVKPDIVLVTASGFGSDGPYRDYAWSHLIGCAIGGWAHLCGDLQHAPLQSGGALTETLLGAYTAAATLMALEGRHRHGGGEHVDISGYEALVTAALLVTQRYEYSGTTGDRIAEIGHAPSFILPCGDGYVGANVLTNAQWEMMCAFFGRPELVDDPRFVDPLERMRLGRELKPIFEEAVRGRTPEEVFHEAQEWRIPFGLIPTLQDAFDLPPHRERGFFAAFDHPRAGPVRMPGIPFLVDGERPRSTRPPLLGEHNDAIFSGLPAVDTADTRGAAGASEAPPGAGKTARPLEGVRIIDLSMFMSGPLATLCLADAGADVIKVESVQRIDGWRASSVEGGQPHWERSPAFNWINRNKRGITLNLTDARGVALLNRLIAGADAVVENYSPRVMENFGLDYASLRAINPNIILLSMPGFGLSGSWRNYVAFASTTEQMAAIPHLTGYAGGQPIFTGTTGGDPLAGVMGAVALLAAIQRRRRLGTGCHIDLSQVEAVTSFVGDVFTAYAITGEDPGRRGNFNPGQAPHGIYPCAEGRWIAIACRDGEEFRALASAMGRADWLDAAGSYATLEGHLAATASLDAAIGDWTASRDASALMHELQAAGIAAAAVMTGKDLLDDPHLASRDFFIRQDRAEVGIKRYPGPPFRFAGASPPARDRPAPTLGEHNQELLGGLLSLSDEEMAALERDDVIGTVPL